MNNKQSADCIQHTVHALSMPERRESRGQRETCGRASLLRHDGREKHF